MCLTCGCGSDDVRVSLPGEHAHDHPHDHGDRHEPEALVLEERLLAKNDHLAGVGQDVPAGAHHRRPRQGP